jgi:hypothetical protein
MQPLLLQGMWWECVRVWLAERAAHWQQAVLTIQLWSTWHVPVQLHGGNSLLCGCVPPGAAEMRPIVQTVLACASRMTVH